MADCTRSCASADSRFLDCHYKVAIKTDNMKTLTITDARQRLGYWLKRAERGEEIGVIMGATVIALRPVPIVAADYAETEYGLTSAEVKTAVARIVAQTRAAKTQPYTPGMLTRANRTH